VEQLFKQNRAKYRPPGSLPCESHRRFLNLRKKLCPDAMSFDMRHLSMISPLADSGLPAQRSNSKYQGYHTAVPNGMSPMVFVAGHCTWSCQIICSRLHSVQAANHAAYGIAGAINGASVSAHDWQMRFGLQNASWAASRAPMYVFVVFPSGSHRVPGAGRSPGRIATHAAVLPSAQ
jgi:hypothetical protein